MASKIPVRFAEAGESGVKIYSGQITGEEYNPKVSGQKALAVWEEMRRSDPTVRQMLWAIKHPISQVDWYIEPASEDEVDQQTASHCEYNLLKLLNWPQIVEQILNYLDYGYCVNEMVFDVAEVDRQLRIVVTKIAYRKPTSIQKWETEDGQPGVTQVSATGKLISIPEAKILRFTNQQEGDNYEGISLLRTAYKPWFAKSKLEMIELVGAERQAVGVPHATYPRSATENDKKQVRKLLRHMRANDEAFLMTPEDWKAEFMNMGANSTKEVAPAIEKYDRQILRNAFAQFLELGGTAAGSRSTSEDHSRFFELALESVARYIQSIINEKLIPTLVDLNFTVKEYPKLQHGRIGDENLPVISEAVSKFVGAKALRPRPEDENLVRKMLGWPELTEDEIKERNEQADQAREQLNDQPPGAPDAAPDDKQPKPADTAGDLNAAVLMAEARALRDKLTRALYDNSRQAA